MLLWKLRSPMICWKLKKAASGLRTSSTEDRRRSMSELNQLEGLGIQSSSTFSFFSGSWWVGWCPSTNLNVSLFKKHVYRHTQKLCLVRYMGILWLSDPNFYVFCGPRCSEINHDTPHGTVYLFFMVLQQLHFCTYLCGYLSKNHHSN